jgi:hypothetical protein
MKATLLVLLFAIFSFASAAQRRIVTRETLGESTTEDCKCSIEDGPGRSNIFVCATPEKLSLRFREGDAYSTDRQRAKPSQRAKQRAKMSRLRQKMRLLDTMVTLYQEHSRDKAMSRMKRQEESTCDCLDSYAQCLNDRLCDQTGLRGICNWSKGRLFGHCAACQGLVNEKSGLFQSRAEIISKLEYFRSAIEQYFFAHNAEFEEIGIEYDWTSDVVVVTVKLFNTAELDSEVVVGRFVSTLSKLFDVFDGTFRVELDAETEETTTKRARISASRSATGAIMISNEEEAFGSDMEDSSASSVVAGGFLLAVLARLI